MRLTRFARRGLEAVFWITFVLALGVGGRDALAGLPKLGEVVVPSAAFEAQASGRPAHEVAVIPISISHLPPPAPASRAVRQLPAIAIVIDDMGGDLVQNRRAIALPRAVSLSFLPEPQDTPMLVREAKAAGHEILAHVPMQASGVAPSPTTLRVDLSGEENIRRLDWALMRVRGYSGINNHEGSLFTADRLALIPVVEALYGRGVFFLDSRTSAQSEIVAVSRAFGVPSAARDVFLDDVETPEAIAEQLRVLEKTARVNGVAIAIGHPRALTLDAVSRWCVYHPGFRLLPVGLAVQFKTVREASAKLAGSR